MTEPDVPPGSEASGFLSRISALARRKSRARRRRPQGLIYGLGTMGVVGWSVAIPTLAGTALGLWLDQHHPGRHAWTVALLFAGLTLGCLNAWRWISAEERSMHEDEDDDAH